MIWTNMNGEPVRLADGMTHVVHAKLNGTLLDYTACGRAWRGRGEWPSESTEVDCMACIAQAAR